MNSTTLARVIGWVAPQMGVDKERQRAAVVERINSVRSWLFTYRQIREVHFIREGCECIETFVEPCRSNCACKSYRGFTLPAGIRAAEELMVEGNAVQITEARIWPGSGCGDCTMAEKLLDCYLKRPVPNGYEGRIIFRSTEPKDEGKKIGIEYRNRNNKIIREDIVLSHASPRTMTWSPLVVYEMTLPLERCGTIVIATEDGFELGRYDPGIDIPAHCHYRMNYLPCGCEVAWRAVADPLPVSFLTDLVEINNEMLWKQAVQAYGLNLKETKSKAEMEFLAQALANIAALADTDVQTKASPWATLMRPKNNRRNYSSSHLVGSMNYRSPVWSAGRMR